MPMLSDAAAVAAAGGGGGVGWGGRAEGVEISYCFLREKHTGLQSCGATLMQSSEREVAFGAPLEQGLRQRMRTCAPARTGTQTHARTYALARCPYTVYLHLLINQL